MRGRNHGNETDAIFKSSRSKHPLCEKTVKGKGRTMPRVIEVSLCDFYVQTHQNKPISFSLAINLPVLQRFVQNVSLT